MPEYIRMFQVLECPSAQEPSSSQVSECLDSPSALAVPLECTLSPLRVLKCIFSAQVPCECSASNERLQHYWKHTAQSIIYVKECFYMFFSTLKDIIQAQNKKKKHCQPKVLLSTRKVLEGHSRTWALIQHST